MRRDERLVAGARVWVRLPGSPPADAIVSAVGADAVERSYEVVLDRGTPLVVADENVVPQIAIEERPDADFVRELRRAREAKLNDLVEVVLEKLGNIYDEDSHLIDELIQNAEDAEASAVWFTVAADSLVVRNNGRPFTRSDVDTITYVTRERSKAKGKIGRHGIGFRSVYAVTDRPTVASGPLAFTIEHGLVPRLSASPVTHDRWGTTFILPYRPGVAINDQPYPIYIAGALRRLAVRTLLFLRNVRRLKVESSVLPGTGFTLLKTEEPVPGRGRGSALVSLREEAHPASEERWLLFRDPPNGAVEGAVEVAFRVEAGELVPFDGVLHVFLPTSTRTRFPFLLSGDFTSNKSRNGIVADDPHNRTMLHRAGNLVASVAEQLRVIGDARATLLGVLPLRSDADTDAMEAFVATAQAGVRRKAIIPTRGGRWTTPEKAVLLLTADAPLAELLSTADVALLFGPGRTLVDLTESQGARACQLLADLDIATWGTDHLRTFLSDRDRLHGRSPRWFARLYAYLGTCPHALRAEVADLPLVLCQDGALRSAKDGVLLPRPHWADQQEVYELFGDRYALVHRDILRGTAGSTEGEDAAVFLRDLGIEQLSYQKVIEEWMLPAFTAEAHPDPHLLDRYVDFLRRRLHRYQDERMDTSTDMSAEDALAPVREALRLRATGAAGATPVSYLPPHRLLLADAYRERDVEGARPPVVGVPRVSPGYLRLRATGSTQGSDAGHRASWRHFLLAVGVQDALDPAWVIEQVILPRHRSDRWKTLRPNELLADVEFARRHVGRYQEWARPQQPATERSSYSAARELGKVLWIRTKHTDDTSSCYDRAPNLYAPTEARAAADFEALFAPVVPPERFIHGQYFGRRPEVGPSWPVFFESLGAATRLRITPSEHGPGGVLPDADPRRAEGGWPPSVRNIGGVADDWAAPDLESLFKILNDVPTEERVRIAKLAFEVLQGGWDRGEPVGERYSSKTQASLRYEQPYQRADTAMQRWPWPSQFSWLLRKTAWLPDCRGRLHAPGMVLANTAKHRILAGTVAPLLGFEVQPDSALAIFLGLNRGPSVNIVMDQLAALARSGQRPEATEVASIYQYLAEQLVAADLKTEAQKHVRARFGREALLYLPTEPEPWRTVAAVFFTGPGGVFGESRAYLKPYYPSFWPLFDALGVAEAPSIADYLRFAAEELALESTEIRLTRAARAWVAAARLISDRGEPAGTDAEALRALPCLGATDGTFRAPAAIWVDDDASAGMALRAKIPILAVPADVPMTDLRALLNWLQVPSLARSVRRSLAGGLTGVEDPVLEQRVRGVTESVQRWLFHKHPVVHEDAMATGKYALLASLPVHNVDGLRVAYKIDGVVARAPADAALLVDKGVLYRRPGTPVTHLAPEITRLFGAPDGLDLFLMAVLSDTSAGLGALLDRLGVRPLPEGARRWQPEEVAVAGTMATDGTVGGAGLDQPPEVVDQDGGGGTQHSAALRGERSGTTFGDRIAADLERGATSSDSEPHNYGGSIGLPVEAILAQGEAKIGEVRSHLQRRIEEDRKRNRTAPLRRTTYAVVGRQLMPELRAFLLERYGGRCQICGDSFEDRAHQPFFITHHILAFAHDGFDSEANVLCLCPKHSAMLQHARCRLDLEQVRVNLEPEKDGFIRLPIEMAGSPEQVTFAPDHYWPFAELCRMPAPPVADNTGA